MILELMKKTIIPAPANDNIKRAQKNNIVDSVDGISAINRQASFTNRIRREDPNIKSIDNNELEIVGIKHITVHANLMGEVQDQEISSPNISLGLLF